MKRADDTSIFGLERDEVSVTGAVLFVLGLGVTLICSTIGIQWVSQQMAAADGFKSDLVALVLGLGLVLVGPVLLLALATLFPSGGWRALRRGMSALFKPR